MNQVRRFVWIIYFHYYAQRAHDIVWTILIHSLWPIARCLPLYIFFRVLLNYHLIKVIITFDSSNIPQYLHL